jgi:hypothetical protein
MAKKTRKKLKELSPKERFDLSKEMLKDARALVRAGGSCDSIVHTLVNAIFNARLGSVVSPREAHQIGYDAEKILRSICEHDRATYNPKAKKKASRKKNPDAKSIMRRAMRGT